MVLDFFSKKKPPVTPAPSQKLYHLASLFEKSSLLPIQDRKRLTIGLKKGIKSFQTFNNCRLQLALDSFDESMKKALFEILFLLHTNKPFLKNLSYTYTRKIEFQEKKCTEKVNLYLEGAPSGVQGIDNLSPIFQEEFKKHIEEVFEEPQLDISHSENPFVGVFSIGSIGTVGHKHLASDLDLEVVYRLKPFIFNPQQWDDGFIKEKLRLRIHSLGQQYIQKFLEKQKEISPQLRKKVQTMAQQKVAKHFPLLFHYLILEEPQTASVLQSKRQPKLIARFRQEVQILLEGAAKQDSINKHQESLLKKRVQLIQQYVNGRYPTAEIYLFAMSEEEFEAGKFSSTLESKESSGSAYELILNYDTLMPGIYFTPSLPTHFLFDTAINNRAPVFKRFQDMLRWDMLPIEFSEYRPQLLNQGATPNLDPNYVGNHSGAVYWEAFKASFGNLPKAFLNLCRYEMLLEPHLSKTVIQLIKDPESLNEFIPPEDKNCAYEDQFKLIPAQLIQLELEFPNLAFDPWWLRYRALRIGYSGLKPVQGIDKPEQAEISLLLDLAFALHVRLSDIFDKPGGGQEFSTHREKALRAYLDSIFPRNSEDRINLEYIFIGDIRRVQEFETSLRQRFQKSIERVREKLQELGIPDDTQKKREFKIWYHYYQKNFERAIDVVPITILKHLMVSRGRVQIGYEQGQGWFFQAYNRRSSRGKRFTEGDTLDQLPEVTRLVERGDFLMGLATCVFNGYYGILNQGTLKEQYTDLELIRSRSDLGDPIDNEYAYLRPGQVEDIMKTILQFFPRRAVNYKACLYEKVEVVEVMLLLNLHSYGRLSFLYRDNMGVVRVAVLDNLELKKKAETLVKSDLSLLQESSIHHSLARFLNDYHIDIRKVRFGVWVNRNSFSLGAPRQDKERRREKHKLNKAFLENIFRYYYELESPYKDKKSLLERESLEEVIFTCAMALAMGGNVRRRNYGPCQIIMKKYWKKEYGDPQQFLEQILKRLERFMDVGMHLHTQIKDYAIGLSMRLSSYQQQILFQYLKKTLRSDYKNKIDRSYLLPTFEAQFFGLPPSK